MEFKKINEGEAESDMGFKVRVGHSRLTYFETGIVISFDAEHMVDGTLFVYGFLTGRPSDAGVRRQIIENIRNALTYLGVKFGISEEVA
jgi:hypothetical protein